MGAHRPGALRFAIAEGVVVALPRCRTDRVVSSPGDRLSHAPHEPSPFPLTFTSPSFPPPLMWSHNLGSSKHSNPRSIAVR